MNSNRTSAATSTFTSKFSLIMGACALAEQGTRRRRPCR